MYSQVLLAVLCVSVAARDRHGTCFDAACKFDHITFDAPLEFNTLYLKYELPEVLHARLTFRKTTDPSIHQTTGPLECGPNSTVEWNDNYVAARFEVNRDYFCGEEATQWNYTLVGEIFFWSMSIMVQRKDAIDQEHNVSDWTFVNEAEMGFIQGNIRVKRSTALGGLYDVILIAVGVLFVVSLVLYNANCPVLRRDKRNKTPLFRRVRIAAE